MKEFTSSLKFIVSFFVLSLFIQMVFGVKVLTTFMTLVLLGMITVNADKVKELIGKGFTTQ